MHEQLIEEMINTLASELGFSPLDLKELCMTFTAEMIDQVDKLRPAWYQRQLDVLQGLTHNIKGVSANMKFTPLFELAKELNDDLKVNHLDRVESLIQQIEEILPIMVQGIIDFYDQI